MKKQIVQLGKRLNKKELRTITGGLVRCTISPGNCKYYGPGCQEPECQLPEPLDPID